MTIKLVPLKKKNVMAITRKYLLDITESRKEEFIQSKIEDIEIALKNAAIEMKFQAEVCYHPLLEDYYKELIDGGLSESFRNIKFIYFSW